jgi:hypothetical protein
MDYEIILLAWEGAGTEREERKEVLDLIERSALIREVNVNFLIALDRY